MLHQGLGILVIGLALIGQCNSAHADSAGRDLTVTGISSPLPPARAENAIGVWLGYEPSMGGTLHRIELLPDGTGTIAVNAGGDRTVLYRIRSWTISSIYMVAIEATSTEPSAFFPEGVLLRIEGRLLGSPAKLMVIERDLRTGNVVNVDLTVINEQRLLEQSRKTRERAQRDRANGGNE